MRERRPGEQRGPRAWCPGVACRITDAGFAAWAFAPCVSSNEGVPGTLRRTGSGSSIGPGAEAPRQGGDHHRCSDEVSLDEGGGGVVFASERRGGTNEIAVSDTAVRTNRSAGRALQRRRAAAMTMPTTEKKPVTTANPDNGIVSPPSGTSKSTPAALGKRSGEDGGHHRCERGNQAGVGEPAESVGVAGLARCRACDDPGVKHVVQVVPPSFGASSPRRGWRFLAADVSPAGSLAASAGSAGFCGDSPASILKERGTCVSGTGQGPPRQCSIRRWSGRNPLRTPHRTAWVRLSTSILR